MLVVAGVLLCYLAYSCYQYKEARIVQAVLAHKQVCSLDRNGNPVPWKLKQVLRDETGIVLVMEIPDGISTADLTFSPEGLASVVGVLEERFAAIVSVERNEDEMIIEIQKEAESVISDYLDTLPPSPSQTD